MRHATTPKRDEARDHLQRVNIAIDELMSSIGDAPWLRGQEDRLKILYERRDSAVRYMRRFKRD